MNRWIYIDWSLSYHKILNLKTSMKLQLDTTSSGCRGLSTHLILQTIFFLCQMHIHINRRETKLGAKQCVFSLYSMWHSCLSPFSSPEPNWRSPQQFPVSACYSGTSLCSLRHSCFCFSFLCFLLSFVLVNAKHSCLFVFNYNWFCL